LDVLALLKGVPEVVWGMAAGSFFSVLAVVLTNRANLRRLRIQLEHEKEERKKDRGLALRRDLYLEAAEAVSVGIDTVGALGNPSLPVQDLMGPAIERTAAITRVYLVASDDTIAALARFITQLSNAHARLLPLRLKVDSFNEEIGRIDRAVQRASEERDHILSLIRQGSPAGAPDPSRWPMLQDKLDSEQARIDGLLQRRRQLEDQLLPAQRELFNSCREAVRQLNTALVPVLTSVRRELDIPVDEKVLLGAVEEEYRSQSAPIDDFLRGGAPAQGAD